MSVRSKPNREGEAPAEPEHDGSELPEGWASTTVAAVIDDFQPGFASGDKNVEGGVSHLRMNNIGLVGELILDLVRTVPEKLAKPRHDLQPGDVLVCTTNSAKLVGKCANFDLEGRYAFSNHLTRLRPNRDAIDSSYLRWCLWSLWKAGTFDDKCKHWVNQSTIPKDALLEADIPLPPLAEQRRIVGKLELLLGKVSSSQQRLSRVPGLLKRFRQSVLAAACSGKLTADWREQNDETISDELSAIIGDVSDELFPDDLPASWRCVRLDALCELITKGASPKWQGVDYVESGVLFVTSENVGIGRTLLDSKKYVQPKFNEIQPRSILQRGDVLTTLVGASIGRTAIFDSDDLANINQAVGLIRLKPLISNTFIMNVLNSPKLLDHMHDQKVDVARANVSLKDVRVFPIPLPSLSEQQEIVRRVEKLFAFADQIEARLRQAQAHIDRLTQSLLAKAFRGELVPTEHILAEKEGHEYEPAFVLLERIGHQRSTTATAPPRKRNSRKST